MKIEILNWNKYNPRKDIKSTSWLRLENNFFLDPKFYDFTSDEKCFWFYLLCEASRQNDAVVECNLKLISAVTRLKECVILKTVEKLEQIQRVRARDVDVTRTSRTRTATRRDGTRRDETGRDGTGCKDVLDTKRKEKVMTEGSRVWSAYANAYAHKYKVEPVRNAKTNTICKRLVDLVGIEKACLMVEHYLKSNDQWYLKKGHSLEMLLVDYQKILTSFQTGLNMTTTRARQVDELQTNHDVFQDVIEYYEEGDQKK